MNLEEHDTGKIENEHKIETIETQSVDKIDFNKDQNNKLNQQEIIESGLLKGNNFEEHGNGNFENEHKIETIETQNIDFNEGTQKTVKIESGTYKYPQNCELSKCEYYIHWRPLENDQTKVFFTMFAKNRDLLSIGLSTSDQQMVGKFRFKDYFGQIFNPKIYLCNRVGSN